METDNVRGSRKPYHSGSLILPHTLLGTSNATSSVNDHPSIWMQRLPRNQATILTRQEHEACSNLARLAGSPHRRAELFLCIILHGRRNQRCPDRAGSNSIDADTKGDLLVVEPAGEGDDGSFGGCVVEEVRAPDVGIHRGTVDDCIARLEMLEGILGDVEGGVDVGVEGFQPLFSGGIRFSQQRNSHSAWKGCMDSEWMGRKGSKRCEEGGPTLRAHECR